MTDRRGLVGRHPLDLQPEVALLLVGHHEADLLDAREIKNIDEIVLLNQAAAMVDGSQLHRLADPYARHLRGDLQAAVLFRRGRRGGVAGGGWRSRGLRGRGCGSRRCPAAASRRARRAGSRRTTATGWVLATNGRARMACRRG